MSFVLHSNGQNDGKLAAVQLEKYFRYFNLSERIFKNLQKVEANKENFIVNLKIVVVGHFDGNSFSHHASVG
jgi:hypothetical protein